MSKHVFVRRGLTGVVTGALVATPLALGLTTSPAAAAGPGLVITEVYLNGGSAGSSYTNKYVELFNSTTEPITLTGKSVQYRSATGTGAASSKADLAGTLAPGDFYVISGGSNGTTTTEVPNVDQAVAGLNPGGSGGTFFVADGTTLVNPTTVTTLDRVGWGTSNNPEGTAAGTASTTTSLQRAAAGTDTDVNSADFVAAAPTPGAAAGGAPDPDPDPEPGEVLTIAQIQGDGVATTPFNGQAVTTQGVVTAAFPTGGVNGFYLQSGGAPDTPNASDAVFVYGGTSGFGAATPEVGDSVEVTGTAGEFNSVTQITTTAAGISELAAALPAPVARTTIPGADCELGECLTGAALDAEREKAEGEIFEPTDPFTVTDVYDGSAFVAGSNASSAMFGEIGLAAHSDVPLFTPTDLVDAQDAAGIAERTSYNNAHRIILDDGATVNFAAGAGRDQAFPYFTAGHSVRVGANATFDEPAVLTFAFNTWRLQPQGQVTGVPEGITFEQDRPEAPAEVGGDVKIAAFNVLNYFPTLGSDVTGCQAYTDRAGNPTNTRSCTPDDGPRGAFDAASFERQQTKIVDSINTLDADVVTLQEIENSRSTRGGADGRDAAVATLVTALNADAGGTTPRWAYAPSPAVLPPVADEDVIRNAFIYDPSTVELVGDSELLIGNAAFDNARQPFAQTFKAVGDEDENGFAVVVNHFKSKGSGENDGTGQGNANPDRVRQAQALLPFADQFAAANGVERIFLTGDFNAYSMEDPIQVLTGAGYTDLKSDDEGKRSYNFDGMVGSLDHILANEAAAGDVTGVDSWQTNANESVYYEYSRFNSNLTNLYTPGPARASDHNPEIVGLNLDGAVEEPTETDISLLNINDFHGRIDANTTKFATTVEQLRAEAGEENTLFLSAGDNIGASLFASSLAGDQPTIEVLNALGLRTSAVGNHEFDKGFADLRGRVRQNADWTYLGANVYREGTTTPVLDEYDLFEVDGVTVAVVGAVTEETPSLVSPAGVEGLDFDDPVEAVNRVAARLTDGIETRNNDEADVIVAEYHEGAGAGTPDGATLEEEVAAGGAFATIVEETSPEVDAIFTGHTHKQYAWDAPVPGQAGKTRPVLQTGSYGENIGQIVLTVDSETGDVSSYTQRNVARAAAENLTFPRVAQVKQITDAALAEAAVVGNQPVGEISADITTAFAGGSYGPNGYTGGTRDDRGSESTLGDLVANALRDGISDLAEPDLALTNSGGLRAELLYAGNTAGNPANTDGVVTYAEANAVLPFSNTVAILELKGADLKAALEEQWQTVLPGSPPPSRPYAQLGLSDNVRVTADPTNAAGERITSVFINDEPLDPARTYTISTLSFLATGGDNFRSLANGEYVDTGLLDAEMWREYLAANSADAPISPDFARQQVFASDLPEALVPGEAASFTLGLGATEAPILPINPKTLNLTSLGSPVNTTVVASIGDTEIGTFPVTDGIAAIELTVPAGTAEGELVSLVAQPSGTTVTIPVSVVDEPQPPAVVAKVTADVKPNKVKVNKTKARVVVTVRGDGQALTGWVRVKVTGQKVKVVKLVNGRAVVTLAKFAKVGKKTVTVRYNGSGDVAAVTKTLSFRVVR
ncbi:ExeM/NucH family extracellular endonuclease [Nocardioides dongxiaopingii]|uniref:ExeM/NucH family extracellular endonuclease n=1 Tax=Nocardioides sp. S-1144 TaxID=2582905 RepID=UPI0011648A3D|nr:ExeM/NucH family extracellular endonuclease [Nocardioides sp. S-1144]QCW51074.2 ExeM/NucH family extracellular endonuclease [Nocardioides sp. S-1144]